MDKQESKRLKGLILKHIANYGQITTAQGKDLIRDAFDCDANEAYEHFMGNFVRSAISSLHDSEGVRTVFSTRDAEDKRLFINIETCRNPKLVEAVRTQLKYRESGIRKSQRKCSRRLRQIEGQMSFKTSGGSKR
jgi:hypothetical protein